MKHFSFLVVCVVLFVLAGCASNPLKPPRPDGKRVPINVTPPAAVQADQPATASSVGVPFVMKSKGGRHE